MPESIFMSSCSGVHADDCPAITACDREGLPMWSPWLPIASPPTPPVRPKAKAFVKEQLSSEAVPEVKRRRRWSRNLHFPEEFRCRVDSVGEAAVAVVACPDAHDTDDVSVPDIIQGPECVTAVGNRRRLAARRRYIEESKRPENINGHLVKCIINYTGMWRDPKKRPMHFYVCVKCGQAGFRIRARYKTVACEEDCGRSEAGRDKFFFRRVGYLNRIHSEVEIWRREVFMTDEYVELQAGIDAFSSGVQAARNEVLQTRRAVRLRLTSEVQDRGRCKIL